MRPVIAYRDTFRFEVKPDVLWQAIEHTESFEAWWPWLREFRLEGEGLVSGSVMHGVVVPPLPYRMRLDVELVRCRRPSEIDAVVRGDLEGVANLQLHDRQGGTQVDVAWTIEMKQKAMRLASKVAHPVLRFGHDAVVRMTVASFRDHVQRVAHSS